MAVATTTRAILEARGIARAADEANWQAQAFAGDDGWSYPVYNSRGEAHPSRRWKNADSHGGRKYAWIPEKPKNGRYYLLPDTLKAIRDTDGVCYLASGEPDVLAYRAAGIKNVISYFDGETSVPDTLVNDLETLGIQMLIYYPDRDKTGLRAAGLIMRKLDGALSLLVYALPRPVEDKSGYDINKLWIDCGFDVLRFKMALEDCEPIDIDDLTLYGREDYAAAQTPLTPVFTGDSADKLPPRFKETMIRDVESMPGFRRWEGDGWANFRCPLHDDHQNSAGYNRETHSFKCFVCGNMKAKDYGAQRNIILHDYFDTPLPKPSANGVGPAPADSSAKTETAGPIIQFVDSYEVAQEIIAELRGEIIPKSEPMPFPFTIYHEFGGFAEYMWSGKMVYISGVSGGGKTAYGETLQNGFLKMGRDTLWYGPEWKPSEMGYRNLQRHGGISMDTIAAMRIWRADAARGVPIEKRRGQPPPQAAVDDSIAKMQQIGSWAGRAHYVPPGEFDLNQLLDGMEEQVIAKREAGRKVSALFFDYLQRAPKNGKRDWDWGEVVVGRIKGLCERQDLFGFVFVQPNKSDSRKVRDGEQLTEASGQGVSDQQANLYITITSVFDAEGKQKQPFSKVSIVKNSMGKTGYLWQRSPLQHLAWLDEKLETKMIDLNSISMGKKDDE